MTKFIDIKKSMRERCACRICGRSIDNTKEGYWVYINFRVCLDCEKAGEIDILKLGDVKYIPIPTTFFKSPTSMRIYSGESYEF